MKTYEVLGIKIKDHSVREALRLTRDFLSDNSPSVVYFLTKGTLLEAADSEEYRAFLENAADITMIATPDIFKAAGVEEKGRAREMDRNLYLKGLLRFLSREHRRIYLMSQTPEQMSDLKHLLATFENTLQIAGVCDNAEVGAAEDVTNDINTVTPYVVFAVLTGKDGADFVNAAEKFMNTRLIVVLQPELLNIREDGSVRQGLMARLSGKLFTRIAGRYK
ncbi:MAG: hypothetical protein IJ827_05825 [Lachnospiraceae bacterium]|nr:hypothetical protein [Lachnospiraceae bacterium]